MDIVETKASEHIPLPVPVRYPVRVRQRIRSVFCFLLLLSTGFMGCIFLQAPLLPLALVAPRLFLFIVNATVQLWTMLSEVVLGGILQIQVRQFGDKFTLSSGQPVGSSIVILNHRTRLDWLFVWSLGTYANRLKIVLKDELRHLPGVGWAMQVTNFIFLKRRIAVDQARIAQAIRYLIEMDGSTQILIFPEGTNLCRETIVKSDEFAKKTGRPQLSYVLHPRVTGFEHFIKTIGSDLTYIYDVTVGYPYVLTESELMLALGESPQEVHYYVRRWPVADVPVQSSEKLDSWLDQRWQEKEQILKNYYEMAPDNRKFPSEVEREGALIDCVDEHWSGAANAVLIFWLLFLLFCFSIIYSYWLIRIYILFVVVVFVILANRWPGGLGEGLAEKAGFPISSFHSKTL